MARPLRIEFEGACYHVLSRGNNRKDVFRSEEDREDFLELLEEMVDRFSIVIYAYVLMGNHYHLLLKTEEPNLSRAMQWLGTSYTRRFNIRHMQSGHLFQGRFKSILVQNDSYLITLSCYIHRNPLRAKMVERLSDYPWSSYQFYAYGKEEPEWLNTQMLLSHFGSGKEQYTNYRRKVKKYSDEDLSIWEDVKHGLIYGSQAFVERIKAKYLSDKPDRELPQLNQMLRSENPDALIKEISNALDCDIETLRSAGRLTGANRDKRDVVIKILLQTGKYSNQQIGELVGLTYSSVSKRLSCINESLKKGAETDFAIIYQRVMNKFKV
ncbi:transposase [uncultured Desulfobacter sp.]|uniref:transposase n=1 Tax=uncultured Desulfobacter sp. TaxID=240139 RepID=UPI0029F4739B|nr:transposase [uncultured Desulfobacter sp.]